MQSKRSMVKLSEVLTERKEKPDLYAILNGEIPIVAKIGFDTGKIELREESKTKTNMILIKPGDLVVSGINAAKGAIAIYGQKNTTPAAATIHYSSYITNKEKADSVYLWHFMRSDIFRMILKSNLPRGIKTEVKPKRLLPIEIPLPPIEEQKRIVVRVKKLMQTIESARTILRELNEENQALIDSLISNILEEITNKHSGHLMMLSEACKLITDGTHDTPAYVDEGMPLLTAKNVFFDRIDTTNVRFISQEDHEEVCKRCPAERNDVLFINIGATTGTVKKIDIDLEFSLKNVALLKPNLELLNPDFLVLILRGPVIKKQIKKKQSQTCQPFLSLRDLRRLEAPIPPLSEQRRCISYTNSLQKKIEEIRKLRAEIEKDMEELIPSILNQAFTGKL